MTRIEQRLTDTLFARAEAVDPNSVRPLPWAASVPGRRPSRRSRKWLAPASAAISIALVATAVTVISRHSQGAGQVPTSSERAAFPGELQAVDALSATDVWAVGSIYLDPTSWGYRRYEPAIMHWDGHSWRRVTAPFPAGDQGQLMSIAGSSPEDLWAVGYWFSNRHHPSLPMIMHWNGRDWQLARFTAGTRVGQLLGVSVQSATDVWAVGDGRKKSVLILRWNGRDWIQLPAPHPAAIQALTSVSTISVNDAWAVGVAKSGDLIAHWNGRRWGLTRAPSSGLGHGVLESVTALSANEVWAAGDEADGEKFQVVRWDGTTWHVVPGHGLHPFVLDFQAIAAASANDLWAVGEASAGSVIMHWNGRSWSQPTGSERNLTGTFSGLSARSADDVWAVGSHGDAVHQVKPIILHWNGTSWTKVLS